MSDFYPESREFESRWAYQYLYLTALVVFDYLCYSLNMDIKFCSECKTQKPVDEFSWRRKAKKQRQSYCKLCMKVRNAVYYVNDPKKYRDSMLRLRTRNQDFILKFLVNNHCVDCGEADALVLEFDHVRGTKVDGVSTMVRKPVSLDVLKLEIAKCEVRCANCHRRKTAKQLGFYKSRALGVD